MSILSENFTVPVPVLAKIVPISITSECARTQLAQIFQAIIKLGVVDVDHWTFSNAYKLIQYTIFIGQKFIPNINKYFEGFDVKDRIRELIDKPLSEYSLHDRVRLNFLLESTEGLQPHRFTYSQETYITKFKFNNFDFSLAFNSGDNEFLLTPTPRIDDEFAEVCCGGKINCTLSMSQNSDITKYGRDF